MNKKVEREEMELMALKECCSYKLQYSYKLFLYLWLVKHSTVDVPYMKWQKRFREFFCFREDIRGKDLSA